MRTPWTRTTSFILHNAISGHQFDPRLEIWPRIDWLRVVADGGDPVGVSFDPEEPPVSLRAGNYVVAPGGKPLATEYSYVDQSWSGPGSA